MRLFEWKDIPGYEGLYQASTDGRIKSLARFNPNSGRAGMFYRQRELKTHIDHNGYLQVRLCKNGKYKTFKVHRLIALTYIPNANNLPSINHKDENKLNNHIDNLEWCTIKYNNNYNNRQTRISKKREKKILQIDPIKDQIIRIFNSITEAENITGYHKVHIINCCKCRKLLYKGFKWEYYETI